MNEAFAADNEPLGGLVDAIRANGNASLSLVAESAGEVVDHILFSPLTVTTPDGGSKVFLGLGPLAVGPSSQGQGIGSRLVREGLDACRRLGHEAVFLLGAPDYYSRFGFGPARLRGIGYAGDLRHPDAWLCVELREGALAGLTGVARFSPEFAAYE